MAARRADEPRMSQTARLSASVALATAALVAAMVLGNVVPALLAVSLFACVDGLAYYALLQKWKCLSFTVAIRFYATVAIAAGILSLVFWRLQALLG